MLQRHVIQRLCIKHTQLHPGGIQQRGQAVVIQQVNGIRLHGVPAAVLVLGQVISAFRRKGQQVGLHFRQRLCVGGNRCRGFIQPPAGGQLVHFQLSQQLGCGSRVPGSAAVELRRSFDGSILADGAQHVGKFGQLLVGFQLFPLFGFDGLVVQVLIHALQTAELLHQGKGGLFANAGHTGNIIGSIAHQAFYFDQLRRGHAVFFLDGGGVHGQRFAVGGKQHRGGIVYQLQAVPVTGRQQSGAPGGLVGGGQRAQDIVRFPAGLADLHKAEVSQQLLQDRHLLGQLVGHPVAGGLVTVVHLVAEGGGFEVERHGDLVRGALLEQGVQNIQKAENGVGIAAVLGGQQLDAVKGTVGNAVAVNDQ